MTTDIVFADTDIVYTSANMVLILHEYRLGTDQEELTARGGQTKFRQTDDQKKTNDQEDVTAGGTDRALTNG